MGLWFCRKKSQKLVQNQKREPKLALKVVKVKKIGLKGQRALVKNGLKVVKNGLVSQEWSKLALKVV